MTNMELMFVGDAVENYGISGVTYSHLGSQLKVDGFVTSYESDATVTVGLFIDGSDQASHTQQVSLTKGEPGAFALETFVDTYASLNVKVLEEDGLALDNQYIVHEVKSENSYKTLVVGENTFFVESAIKSMLNAQIDVIKPEEYSPDISGYGLYVFDCLQMSETFRLPTDGTVWLIGIAGSVEGAGYTVQGEMELKRAEVLDFSTSTSTATQTLLADLKGNDIYITRYIKCGFYRNFTTLLSYKGSPVVFAGTNEYGAREVVFAFDLHDSNLPLLHDFAALMRNLINYSFPDMVEDSNYECGETAQVNMIANCDSVRVESPSGDVNYLNVEAATDEIRMTEVGVYTVTMSVSGTARQFYIWSSLNEAERAPTQEADSIGLQGEAGNQAKDGKYDPLTVMFIVLAVIFLADWMVYCYEKYQLR